jgi:HK97 family phage portal protein
MGILATIEREIRASSDEAQQPGPTDDFWYNDPGDFAESDAGIRMSPQGALRISTVWKCVNWYFKMYGTLPHKIKERTELLGQPAEIEAPDHALYPLIHVAPSPLMTAAYWHGLIAADLKLWGNSYAYIQRNPVTAKKEYLWRIRPDFVRIEVRNKASLATESVYGSNVTVDPQAKMWYCVRDSQGGETKFYPEEILHIRGLGFDGIKGYSPIRMQMNLLGWNRATTRYGAQFFKNASRPSGIVSTPGPLPNDKGQRDGVIANLTKSGKEAGKLMLIEGAVTYHKLTMDQDEAQFILTANMQEEDIAGIMDTKPVDIGIMRHMTNNNVEQETISSVTRNLRPFAISIEQWFNLQLLSDRPSSGRGGGTERERFFFESELKALLRGDTAAQTAHVKEMISSGVYTPNMGCDYMSVPRYEGGDVHVINRAFAPVETIDEWSKVSQNNPPASSESDPQKPAANRITMDASGIFRDAIGRVVGRKGDRAKSVAAIFEHVLLSLAVGMDVVLGEEFTERYLAAMGKRAADWEEPAIDTIAADELERAVHAIQERQQQES